MARPRNDLLDRLVYLALRLVSMFIYCFPIESNLRLAKALGAFVWFISRKHRDRALENLRHSYPEKTEEWRYVTGRESMRQFFMLFFELLFTPRLVKVNTHARYVEFHNSGKCVELMLRRKGLIVITGHFGNWEIVGYTVASLGLAVNAVARPLDNPYANDWLVGVRERHGLKLIDKSGATSAVTSVLEQGGTVTFIVDQNAGSKGIFVDFFGRKASTFKSIGLVAMQYEVPVVITYGLRLDDRFHFRIGVEDIIYPEDWQKQDDPLRYITQRYTSALESFIRRAPEQYLWVHRRWKTRPKGELET